MKAILRCVCKWLAVRWPRVQVRKAKLIPSLGGAWHCNTPAS